MIMKLDFRNAFNTVRRDVLLSAVQKYMPAYARIVDQMYRSSSVLLCDDNILSSESGGQQGDPLGPLFFCLVVQGLAESLQSDLNLWYLDDATLEEP